MIRTDGIDHVALAVRDVERSAAWYQEVLGLSRLHQEAWGSYPAVVGTESTAIALFPIEGEAESPPGRNTIAMRHLAFRVSREELAKARVELTGRGIETEFQDHGIAHSIYFTDPDGHQLELTTYEL